MLEREAGATISGEAVGSGSLFVQQATRTAICCRLPLGSISQRPPEPRPSGGDVCLPHESYAGAWDSWSEVNASYVG